MKICKPIIPFILLSLLIPLVVQAQGFQRQRQLKSVSEARGLAVNNTVVPVITGVGAAYLFRSNTVQTVGAALAVYGLVVGPSGGNLYAEDYLRGSLGIMARAGSGYLLLNATRELMGDRIADPLGWDDERVSLADTKVLVGAGLFVGSMIYSYVSSKASVSEYNRSLGYAVYLEPYKPRISDEVVPLLTARFTLP